MQFVYPMVTSYAVNWFGYIMGLYLGETIFSTRVHHDIIVNDDNVMMRSFSIIVDLRMGPTLAAL